MSPAAAGPRPGGARAVSSSGILHRSDGETRERVRRGSPPFPVEPFVLVHPAVPPGLDGLTILHVTDLHVRKGRPCPEVIRRSLEALASTPADVVVHTGDWMNYPGDEASALRTLGLFASAWRSRSGVFGTFGNHDSAEFRARALGVPGITWLGSGSAGTEGNPGFEARPVPGLRLLGFDEPEDLLGQMLKLAGGPTVPRGSEPEGELTIGLVHYPTEIYPAADFEIPILLAGHTHGGQFRLTHRFAPHTSSDLPKDLASGVLRLRQTLCCVSRGVGNAIVEFRVNCPPQIPLYTLRRGPLPPIGREGFNRVTLQRGW